MKDAFYFPHDSNAQNDEKILQLRAKHGWFGYGLYWALIERLRDQQNYRLPIASIPALKYGLIIDDDEILNGFINDCCAIGLLSKDEHNFFSESLLRRMKEADEKRDRLREAGRRGGLISSHAQARLKQPSSSKGKESKVKEIKQVIHSELEKSPLKTKIYPTKEEAVAFFTAEGMPEEGVNFWTFYEMRGWVQGASKIPIKKWKMAAARWINQNRKETKDPYANLPNQVL